MGANIVRWPGRWRRGVITAAAQACVLAVLGFLLTAGSLEAALVVTGNVTPALPWSNTTSAYVGNTAGGTLSVDAGSQLSSGTGCLGYNAGATGVATISGSGSKWTSNYFYVGNSGSGTLQMSAGGQVNGGNGYLGYNTDATGVATICGSGSQWINGDLYVGRFGSGTLNVASSGQVSSFYGYLGFNPSATGVATIAGSGTQWTSRYLYVGNSGSGTLNVAAGGQIIIAYPGCLGSNAGASGVATISGAGSKWTNGEELYVGLSGSGTLNVASGAQVSNNYNGGLGYNPGGSGVATITGSGSKWTDGGSLYVGLYGRGTLQVSDGGQVTAGTVSVNAQSLLAIDVGNGSALSVKSGTGTITNNGKARFTAAAGAAAGQYTPIAANTFTGSGAYTAVGGVWDSTSHVFMVSPQVTAVSGMSTTLDVASQQRLLVSDSQSGWNVGASLLAKTGSATQVNVTATAMPYSGLGPLTMQFDPKEDLLGAWQFSLSGSGYSVGDPVYLSYPVADGTPLSELHVWHWDGTNWDAFSVGDLNVSQGYANFTATSFSGYAVSVVPEPSTLALLGTGVIGLLACRWRGRYTARGPK